MQNQLRTNRLSRTLLVVPATWVPQGRVRVGVGSVRWWLRWLGALAVYHVLLAFMVQPLVLPKDRQHIRRRCLQCLKQYL